MIRNLVIIKLVICSYFVYGQQWNQISMSNFHPYFNNAAYAGFDRAISTTILSRNQWAGFVGAPKVRYIGSHLPVYIWKAGFGADLFTLEEGSLAYRSARISANKIFDINGGLLSGGIRIGLHSLNINGAVLTTPEGNYNGGTVNHNDPLLENVKFSGVGIGWEGSIWYRKGNYQLGFAINELPSNSFSVKNVNFELRKNFNLFFQTIFDYSETIQFQPSISIKTDLNYIQTEILALTRINGNIFGGMMLRGYSSSSIDALGIMLGHRINKRYSIYYNYDAGLSKLRKTNEGSHEIMLKIDFFNLPGSGIPPKIIYNPRYLE